MAHPHWRLRRESGKERGAYRVLMENREPILAFHPASHFTAKLVRHNLHPIANTQHREMAFVDKGWGLRCIWLVNAAWPTGEDKTLGAQGGNYIPRDIMWNNLAVYPAFSYSACDEPAILRAEVNDYHRLPFRPELLLRLS
jgi:hypothetical protein